MSKDEMVKLKKLLLTEINEKQNIILEIDKILSSNIYSEFFSDFIPYYRKENEDACNRILEEIELDDLYFFVEGFFESGNRLQRIDFYKNDKNNPLTDMADIYDFPPEHLKIVLRDTRKRTIFNVDRIDEEREVILPISKIEEFFKKNDYSYGYEKAYNNFNYIKNFIYKCLLDNPNASYNDIFKDLLKKQLLVKDKLAEISSYLYDVRSDGDLKLSVSNAGLKKNIAKVTPNITYRQERLIEAIAFGTTLENLEIGNYEDSKKLIYLPRKK